MSCNCQNKSKNELSYIRSLAIKQSIINEEDIQIYQELVHPHGLIYNYEPINIMRNNIIEYVKYKNVKLKE